MSWKKLTVDDLRLILSEDEVQRLNTLSLDNDLSAVIDHTMEIISDTWRGALISKGFTLDTRDHYTPSEYSYWILVHCRYAVWTRFPNTPEFALDEARKAEYEKAMEILKDPPFGVSRPDPQYDPGDDGNMPGGGSIVIPELRFDEDLGYYQQLGVLKTIQ